MLGLKVTSVCVVLHSSLHYCKLTMDHFPHKTVTAPLDF